MMLIIIRLPIMQVGLILIRGVLRSAVISDRPLNSVVDNWPHMLLALLEVRMEIQGKNNSLI
jgi:hypothetical protein